jgi:hypothetical protein
MGVRAGKKEHKARSPVYNDSTKAIRQAWEQFWWLLANANEITPALIYRRI